MKKLFLSILAWLLIQLLPAQNLSAQGITYQINGKLKGIRSGKIFLQRSDFTDRTTKSVDSAKITDGSFVLTGRAAGAEMLRALVMPGNWAFDIFLDNGKITVSADTAGAEHFDYTKYGYGKGAIIKNVKESGSKNYDIIAAYQSDPGQRQFAAINNELNRQFKLVQGKDIDAEYKVRGRMDSVNKLLQAWQFKQIKNYVSQNSGAVGPLYLYYVLYTYSNDTKYQSLSEMLDQFTGDAKNSVYYSELSRSRNMLAAVQPGAVAPDFTLMRPDSSKLSLSAFRGKYVMIDFWASWCHPCREAIPHWKLVYAKYHDKGFDILSVSDDSSWKSWKIAMDQEKMPWAQVCDEFPIKNMPARVGALYMTHTIPHYVLLDKEGKILVKGGDEKVIDEKLSTIFKD